MSEVPPIVLFIYLIFIACVAATVISGIMILYFKKRLEIEERKIRKSIKKHFNDSKEL
jgi:hypothetical protein